MQLNASASVPGALIYTPAAGTVLAAGTTTLSVTFTPTDTPRLHEHHQDGSAHRQSGHVWHYLEHTGFNHLWNGALRYYNSMRLPLILARWFTLRLRAPFFQSETILSR